MTNDTKVATDELIDDLKYGIMPITSTSGNGRLILSLIARIESDRLSLAEKEIEIANWRCAVQRYFDLRDYHRPDAEKDMKALLDRPSKGSDK